MSGGGEPENQATEIVPRGVDNFFLSKPSIKSTFKRYIGNNPEKGFSKIQRKSWILEYRVRHHIPSVEEIAALRRQCKFSAAKMSALLGIGINQYRLYEAGEMPSLSIGKILYALCHNPETLMFYLKNLKK